MVSVFDLFITQPIINLEDTRSYDAFCFSAHGSEMRSLNFKWSIEWFILTNVNVCPSYALSQTQPSTQRTCGECDI